MKHVRLYEELDRSDFYQGKQIKVQIIKCENPMYWYKNYINKIFNVVEDDSKTKWGDGKEKWKVVPDKNLGGVNYINKEDCKIIS